MSVFDSKPSLPATSGHDEEYEVLDVSGLGRGKESIMDRFVRAIALAKSKPVGQVALGGAGGWIVGFVFTKFGRVAASSVGGGILLLQLANQSGYISIDWRKVNRDVNKAQEKINDENPQIRTMMSKVQKALKSNAAVSVGFVGGFLLGIAT